MPTPADTDRAQQIEVILAQVDNLPTLSPIATRLLEISNVEDADLDRLVEVIETDPALCARLLGLCRRADKGLGDRITTVRRAVVMLGLEAVQSAALSVAVYELMEQVAPGVDDPADAGGPGDTTVPFDREGFWKHSIAVGSASELIAESHLDLGVRPEEAFVAGLIHDLGKMVLDLVLPRAYGRVLGLAERRGTSSTEAELHLLGVDHHTIGKRLAEHWGLPSPLRDTIWLHGQTPATLPDVPHRNLIGIVGVARNLTRHLHLGWCGDFNHAEPLEGPRGVCRQFGLNAELVEAAVSRLHENVSHRCSVLGLGDHSTPELLMQAIAGANRRLGRLTAIFEQRSRSSQRQAKVLQTICDFHASCSARPGRGVVETMAEVVRSASTVLGRGFYGVVYQLREGDPWQLCQFAPDGRPTRSQVIETPPARNDGGLKRASLSALCSGLQISMNAMSLLPWLADYLLEAGDLRDVQLLSLTMSTDGGSSGPAVILLHDRDVAGTMDRAMLQAMTATWGSAIAAAAHQEASRRLGERLAASNRSLTEAQRRLAETESLARLGEMAAGAAHEMNNPLTVISGRAQILAGAKLDAPSRSAAKMIVQASEALTDLITSLRLLADPPRPRMDHVSVADLIDAAIKRARERTGWRGKVEVDAPADATAYVDRELLAVALSELVINGLQSSPAAPVEVRVQVAGPDGRLLMHVQDQGTGMSARALQHAFDPFFSEKPAGRQTGLGLTRARRLVELHSGEISLSSSPGKGTTATIRLGPAPSSSDAQTQPTLRHAA